MKSIFKYLSIFILSMLGSSSIYTRYLPQYDPLHPTDFVDIPLLTNIKFSSIHTSFLVTFIGSFIFFLYLKTRTIKLPKHILFMFLSFILALLWLGAKGEQTFYIKVLIESNGQILKTITYTIGSYWIIYMSMKLIYIFLTSSARKLKSDENTTLNPGSEGSKFFSKHRYTKIALLLFLAWIPHLIIIYPASMTIDSWISLNNFYGTHHFSTHNPMVYTCIIGMFTKFGYWLTENASMGLFILHVIQFIICILIITYSFKLMVELLAPRWLLVSYYFILILCPYWANRINLLVKDIPYSMCFLVFIIEMIYFIKDHEKFISTKFHIFLSLISIWGVYVFSSNGKYILIPTVISILVYLFYKRDILKVGFFKKTLLVFLIPISIGVSLEFIIIKKYDLYPKSPADRLAILLQQTARTIKLHPDIVTPYEQKIIGSVLHYNLISQRYNPKIADPIVDLYRINTSSRNLRLYLKTWFKMFFKAPSTYMGSILHQNYLLFFPFVENDTAYVSYIPSSDTLTYPLFTLAGFSDKVPFYKVKEAYKEANLLLFSLPIIGTLSHPATYILLCLFLLILALVKRINIYIVPMIPILLSLLACILAPNVYNHARYSFPILYSTPVLLAWFINLYSKKQIKSSI